MNANLFQTILTVIATVLGLATTALLNMGCTNVGETISCTASSAPTWLAPYMAGIALFVTLLKLVIGGLEGKLTKPTVTVDSTATK